MICKAALEKIFMKFWVIYNLVQSTFHETSHKLCISIVEHMGPQVLDNIENQGLKKVFQLKKVFN